MLKKDKEIYYIIGITILAIVVIVFFIIPNINKIINISESISENEARLEELQQSGQNKQETLEHYNIVKENLPQLRELIPNAGEELAFITDLEGLATKNNIQQKINISIDEGASKINNLSLLPFQLVLDGNYYSLLSYLRDLEISQYYLNIEIIQINKTTSSLSPLNSEENNIIDTSNNVHAVLTGVSYWQ